MTIDASVLKLEIAEKAGKRPAKKGSGGPRAQVTEEVELTAPPPAVDLGWRSKKRQKTPVSLSLTVVPRVVDVFTSRKGDTTDRRRVFFVGESMQWNVIHRVDPFIKNVPYDITIHVQRLGLGSFAANAARIESVFPIEAKLSATLRYQFQASLESWSWEQVPPFSDTISGTADQIVQGIARGEFGLIAHPGIWRMSAIVTVLSDASRAYHLQSFAWDYEIVGRKRDG